MSEHGDEAPEEQRIKGTGAEMVSYQEGQKYHCKEKRKTVNKPKMTENK